MVATCNVGHAAVAKLHAVFITNFAKLVVAWKVFRQKLKKLLANVGFDAVAVQGLNHTTFLFLLRLSLSVVSAER